MGKTLISYEWQNTSTDKHMSTFNEKTPFVTKNFTGLYRLLGGAKNINT